MPPAAEQRGQASLELLAGLPVLLAAALIGLQLLLVGYALTLADGAAEAGAAAGAAGLDAGEAARGALPGWARGGARVEVSGGSVRVTVGAPSPLGSLVAARLRVSSTAWARPADGGR